VVSTGIIPCSPTNHPNPRIGSAIRPDDIVQALADLLLFSPHRVKTVSETFLRIFARRTPRSRFIDF
jgi:hypothetical protein